MEGEIKRVISSGEFITIIIQIVDGVCGRTYTSPSFRNYDSWKDLKVGDAVGGLRWKNEERGIVDADSPVYLLADSLF
jgi:hypothetical protein